MQFDFQDWVARFGSVGAEPVSVPAWFRWATSFAVGLKRQAVDNGQPLTIVITTPCDSAIAGAIAFGACISCVPELNSATESADLFDEFMDATPGTEIKRLARASEKRTQRYLLLTERSEQRGIAMREVNGKNQGRTHFLIRKNASWYAFVDKVACDNGRALAPYAGLSLVQPLLGAHASTRDWRCHLGSVALCAPTLGAAAIRRETDTIFFSDLIDELEDEHDEETDPDIVPVRRITLTDLLAISQWQPTSDRECPSYCQFVESATKPDDITIKPKLVIFNGPDAYLRLHNRFEPQTHVVVVSRDADPNKLERFLAVTHSIRETAHQATVSLPEPPFGIQWTCLGNRQVRPKQW